MRQTQRLRFTNKDGHSLVGILEQPQEEMKFQVILSHCFTCTKDLKATVRLSRALVARGIGAFRFDFTGLGDSGGHFASSTFDDNCHDLRAAQSLLESQGTPASILVGHSLGGATSLAVSADLPHIKGTVCLAAPSETPHLADTLGRLDPSIVETERGRVSIGGMPFDIEPRLVQGLKEFDLPAAISNIRQPVLLVHSPADETVPVKHVWALENMLRPHASVYLLPDSDHLFTKHRGDIDRLARLIELWAEQIGVA